MEKKDCLSTNPESAVVSFTPFMPNTPPCRSSRPGNKRPEDLPGVKNPWGTKRRRKMSHAALVEKVCVNHPELAICSGSSTPRWCKFACEMSGELLFFLHSTRMREMTEDACKHLKVLWEEAQSLGFDFSWFASGVKFGFNSRSHLEQQRKNVLNRDLECFKIRCVLLS